MSAGEVRTWIITWISGCGNGTGAVRPEQVRDRAWMGQRTDARKRASPVHTGTGLSGSKSRRSGAMHTGTRISNGAKLCIPVQD